MRVAFLITSPYQLFHYKWIVPQIPDATAVIEVRDREYGLSEELVEQHLPGCQRQWVARTDLASLDGQFDAIVCQTPILPLEFLSRTPVVAQQYSLAKERYQYGVWRAHARLNLMYGDYSAARVRGFCHAVAVGNPLFDPYFAAPPPQRVPVGSGTGPPRLLYQPTYGELSSLPVVLPRLRGLAAEVTVKLHHAEQPAELAGLLDGFQVVGSDADPVRLLRTHDGVISDFSGAAYDALYAGLPVVLAAAAADPRGQDYERLSPAERDYSLLADVAVPWEPDNDLFAAFARAEQLLDSDAYRQFRSATFVNDGTAGPACAREIQRLVAEGEPEHFGAVQVREATRRYIVSNRQLRRRAGPPQGAAAEPEPDDNGADPDAAVPTDRPARPRLARGGVRLGYRRFRRLLARSARLRRLVRAARRLRDRRHRPVPGHGSTPPAPPVAPSVADRREEVYASLAPLLSAEGVAVARDGDRPGADAAVLITGKRRVHRALQRLASERPELTVRIGIDWRIVEHLPLPRLSFADLATAHWLELGSPHEYGAYVTGTAGYLTVLFVDHDRTRNRFLARKRRAGRTDWTAEFAASHRHAAPLVGQYRDRHVADPVDVVYTWVDSGDPVWQDAHRRYSEGEDQQRVRNPSANNPERYADREELRYSMRTLSIFAPFVRHIYVVTADQHPSWLAKDHPQVTVVPHREVFPDPSVLPTFNSHAIEACLHRIPDLSERFLYLNDDVFLGREVDAGEFFTMAGLPKVRLSPSQYIYQGEPEADAIPTDWAAYNAVSLLRRDFGLAFDRRVQHVPLSLRRSVLAEIEQRYAAEVDRTRRARFRAVTDLAIPSMFGQFYGIASGQAVEWPGARNEYVYLDTGRHDSLDRYRQILTQRPKFFCLNVTRYHEVELATQATRLTSFLATAFPAPAPWEVP